MIAHRGTIERVDGAVYLVKARLTAVIGVERARLRHRRTDAIDPQATSIRELGAPCLGSPKWGYGVAIPASVQNNSGPL
jgi:hypothetical protein